jgi:hypothetical protein
VLNANVVASLAQFNVHPLFDVVLFCLLDQQSSDRRAASDDPICLLIYYLAKMSQRRQMQNHYITPYDCLGSAWLHTWPRPGSMYYADRSLFCIVRNTETIIAKMISFGAGIRDVPTYVAVANRSI